MTARLAFWRQASEHSRVARAMTSVAMAGGVVKLIAVLKEFVAAGIYGRSDAMDAFLVAFLIPNLLINLFAESMNQALIPTLVRVRLHEGMERANQLFAGSMQRLSVLLFLSMITMAALAPAVFPLLASNFAGPKLSYAIHLFLALLPVVLLVGLASNCAAVLNTVQHFTMPALANALIPFATIVCALLLHRWLGIWAMVFGTLLGAVAQAMLMAWMLRRAGYSFCLQRGKATDASHEVTRQYGPILLSSVVASGGLFADQAMAAMLPTGSVSALVYAGRFVSVVVTLFAGALSSALTPHFATLVARQDFAGCRSSLRYWALITAILSIPIALILIAGAPLLVRLTLQHGAFTQHDTAIVAPVLAMYALQIPFFAVSRVHYRFILAMRRTDLIFYCGLLNLALDIVLNFALMHWMGLKGIALATSLWTISTLIFLWFWSKRILDTATSGNVEEVIRVYAVEAQENP